MLGWRILQGVQSLGPRDPELRCISLTNECSGAGLSLHLSESILILLHISDTCQRYLLKVGFSQTGRPAKRIGCPIIICSRWKLLQGFQSLFQLARESPYFVCSCTHVQDAKHHHGVLVQIVLKSSCMSGFVQETIHFEANLASIHPGWQEM